MNADNLIRHFLASLRYRCGKAILSANMGFRLTL